MSALSVLLPGSPAGAQSIQRDALQLTNSWRNFSRSTDYRPAEVIRQGEVCKLGGLVEGGYRQQFATLPAYCRPNQRLIFQVNTVNHQPLRLDILPNGAIQSSSLWRRMPGVLKQVSIAEDGTIWGVSSTDVIFRWSGSAWQQTAGQLSQVSVGTASRVWGVNANGAVYQRSSRGGWTNIVAPVPMVMVAAAADGTVWGLGRGGEVYNFRGKKGWGRVSGSLKHLSVGSAKHIWGIDSNGKVVRWNRKGWSTVTGSLTNVTVGADGTVWGTNASDQIYRWMGSSWQRTSGAARQVAVGKAGLVWHLNSRGYMYRWVGISWLSLDGITFAAAKGTPVILASGWQNYSGDTGTYRPASVTKDGNLCVVSGLIKGSAWTDLATLPPECRPEKNLIFSLHANQATPARVDVYPSGRIVYRSGGKGNWISLAGIAFSVGGAPALPLASGWSNYGSPWRAARYSHSGELCELGGLIKGGEWGHVATVPAECRPDKRLIFVQHANNATPARMDVLPDGRVMWVSGGRNAWVSLSGMAWRGPPSTISAEAVAIVVATPDSSTSTSVDAVVIEAALPDTSLIAAMLAAGASTPVGAGQAGLGIIGYAGGELITRATLAANSKIGSWTLPADARVLEHAGDFNGDGREDLIIWTSTGLALASISPPAKAGQPGGWQLLTAIDNGTRAGGWQIGTDRQTVHGVGDFNGDGRADLLMTGPNAIGVLTLGSEGLTTLAMHVNGTRLGGWIIDTRSNQIEGLGDFDGNGRADVLITSGWGIGVLTLTGSNLTSVMLKPNGTRFGGWLYDSKGNPIQGIGDFNGDRRADILLTSGWGIGVLTLAGDTFNSVMLKPNGTRFGGWLYDSRGNPIEGIGDFDGNGRDDIVIRSGWGTGLLTLAGDTLNSLTLKPNGTQLGAWTLAKDDSLPATAKFTHPATATLMMQRIGVAPVQYEISYLPLQPIPVSSTVAVLSSDLDKLSALSVSPTSNDLQKSDALNSVRTGSSVLVGRLRQVGANGMTVNNPLLFDDGGVASLAGSRLRFGRGNKYSLPGAGEFRLAPGTFFLDNLHSAPIGSGSGRGCTTCPGTGSQLGCPEEADPGVQPGGCPLGSFDCDPPEDFLGQLEQSEPPPDFKADFGGVEGFCGCSSIAQCPDDTGGSLHDYELPFGNVAWRRAAAATR